MMNWVRAGRLAVLAVGFVTALISYSHIRDWALAHGGDWLTAPLLPLGIDGAVVAMTLFMHQAQGLAQWLSRFGLLVSIGATVAFNTAYGAVFGVAAALGWSIPPVLLVICIEVSVLTVRKTRPAAVPVVAEPVKPEAMPAMVTVRETRRKTPKLTVRQQAALLDKSPRQVMRYRKDGVIDDMLARLAKGDMVTAGPNGKAH